MYVTTYSLELLTAPVEDARELAEGFELIRVEHPTPEFTRFLYGLVGGDWNWNDRLKWTREQWSDELEQPGSEVWVLYGGGAPQGYVQLRCEPSPAGSSVEVLHFGLVGTIIGKGLGGPFLEQVLRAAWTLHTRHAVSVVNRVWLHTCSLDGPAALRNYESRGFKIFLTETKKEDVPSITPGAWAATGGPEPCGV